MKFKISYFYNVRFMKPHQVPISTAVWDPKWYHNNKGQGHVFIDKNGVINGVRVLPLTPGSSCNNLCKGKESCSTTPDVCLFLQAYADQLATIDYVGFKNRIEKDVAYLLSKNPIYNGEEPEAILIVHEAPGNLCSERGIIVDWFKTWGYELEEFVPDKFNPKM